MQLPARNASVSVTHQLGISQKLTDIVQSAMGFGDNGPQNIRAMVVANEATALVQLSAELEFAATSYCGAAKTDVSTFDECMDFTVRRFGHLASTEIREAFRLAAAGELGDVNLQSYYGLFTVTMLGAVLHAYDEYRNRIVAALRRAENDAYLDAREAGRKPHDSDEWMIARVAQLLALASPDQSNTTAYDHDFLEKKGWMQNDKETKEAAWVEAKAIATAQVAEEMQGNNPAIRAGLQAILRDVEAGKGNTDFKSRRVGIAKRLLVCRWITQQRAQEIQ